MDGKTNTEAFLRKIRRATSALLPSEVMTGWLLPTRRNGVVYATVPYFASTKTKAGTGILAPSYVITADWKTGQRHETTLPNGKTLVSDSFVRIVSFRDLRYEETFGSKYERDMDQEWIESESKKVVSVFPHEAVAKLRRSEYLEKQAELYGMYDELFEALETNTDPSPEWTERFRALLAEMVDPRLLPIYRALGPAFVNNFLSPED